MSTPNITPEPNANAKALDFLLSILQNASLIAQGFLSPEEAAIDRAVGGILAIIQKANQAHIEIAGAPLDPSLIRVEEPLPDEPAPTPAPTPINTTTVAPTATTDTGNAAGADAAAAPPESTANATHTIDPQSGARVSLPAKVADAPEQ